jgi:hypothetical protein
MNRDELEKDLNEIITDSTKLLGDVQEMDKTELLEMLNDSELPAETVRQAAFLMFENVVKEYRLRGEYPPQRYLDLATQLRPVEYLSQNQDTLTQQAKKWVAGLLAGPAGGTETSLQFAFHRQAELTDADRKILEEAEADVSRKMKRKK